jgi:hypothetical protein
MRETASDEPHPGLYIALNRIISCLKRYPLWPFTYGILDRTACTTRYAKRTGGLVDVCAPSSGRGQAPDFSPLRLKTDGEC